MHLLLSTVALRPYVFIFLAAFLFIAIINFGLRATLLFTVLTYVVALACEWSSVHDGFPFGLYHYLQATRGREIWVFGVPLMDSLSFTFLAFASYTVALLLTAPLYRRGWDLRLLDTWQLRRSPRVWLMAALFMVMVDMVVDPLSVLGDRWFLGKIFWYDPPGPHLSRALLGPLLYAGIVTFGITMLFLIGAPEIGWASVFIFLPFVVLTLHILTRAGSYGDNAAVARYIGDFPYNRDFLTPVQSPDDVKKSSTPGRRRA